MTTTSSARTDRQQKARVVRGLDKPSGGGPTVSDGEGRSAAAAARGVRVHEGEARLLEVALVAQGHAVQVLGAEAVDEAATAGGLDDDVVLGRLLLDAQAVAEPGAAPGQHADPLPGRLGRRLLLRHELAHLGRRLVGQREGNGHDATHDAHYPHADRPGGGRGAPVHGGGGGRARDGRAAELRATRGVVPGPRGGRWGGAHWPRGKTGRALPMRWRTRRGRRGASSWRRRRGRPRRPGCGSACYPGAAPGSATA